MNLNDLKWVFCLLALPFLLFSCGGSKDDPTPPGPEPPEPPVVTEGSVSLTLDVSTYQPGALKYHFYNTDGVTPCTIVGCDGKGNYTNDKFALGTYRVLAVNTSASGVKFEGMDSHATASVHLAAAAAPVSRADGFTVVSQPGAVYSVVVNELTVTADGTASHSPVPVLLTKSMTLPFTLGNGLENEVASISGVLHGVYPSVSLFTCTPVSSLADCQMVAVDFTASGSGAQRQADVHLFGICDPQGGKAYTNTLYLTLTFSNGDTEELSVDLTDALTEALSENKGSLPADIEFPIEVSREDIGLSATLGDWKAGGESGKEL